MNWCSQRATIAGCVPNRNPGANDRLPTHHFAPGTITTADGGRLDLDHAATALHSLLPVDPLPVDDE